MIFLLFFFGFPVLFSRASPLLSLLISQRDRNLYQRHFSETPFFQGFFLRWCESPFHLVSPLLPQRGLIVSYISQFLRMTITSQLMTDRWIPICQEVFDFNIYISPCSTLPWILYQTYKYRSEHHLLVCLGFFLSTNNWWRTYSKRIIYCNIQEWYLNSFLVVSVSVLASWLANIISALLKAFFFLQILLMLHLLPKPPQKSLNILLYTLY